MAGIAPPAIIPLGTPPVRPTITAPSRISPKSRITPAQPVQRASAPSERSAVPNSPLRSPFLQSPRRRHKDKVYVRGTVTNITSINVNIDSGRIAFLNNESAPILGDVDTDLPAKPYDVVVESLFKRWAFLRDQVPSTYHFNVYLESDLDAFSEFTYENPLPVVVQNGLTRSGTASFATIREWIRKSAENDNWFEVMFWYNTMSDIDLYDMLHDFGFDPETIWVVQNSILRWAFTDEFEDEERNRILRALEYFIEKPEDVYVDRFDRWVVHPSSFGYPDPERLEKGLWNIKLVFTYVRAVSTTRGVMFYLDDIADDDYDSSEHPQFGECAIRMPRYMSRKNCPNMCNAKKDALKQIEAANVEFIIFAWQTVDSVLNMVQAGGSMAVRSMVNARRSVVVLSPGLRASMAERLMAFLKDETGAVNPGKTIEAVLNEAEAGGQEAAAEAFGLAPGSKGGSDGATPVGQGVSSGKGSAKSGQQATKGAGESAGEAKDFSKTKAQPGWYADYEGGANQRASDSRYIAKTMKMPRNRRNVSYFWENKRFDGSLGAAGNPTPRGQKPALLIEGKNWRDGGMFWRILTRRWDGWSAYNKLNSKIAEAKELLDAAGDIPLEYWVNSKVCAEELQKVFDTWGLKITVRAKVVTLPK